MAANEKHGYSHIIAPGTKFGANYLGRAGAQLGVSPISDVVDVLAEGGSVKLFVVFEFSSCWSNAFCCLTWDNCTIAKW